MGSSCFLKTYHQTKDEEKAGLIFRVLDPITNEQEPNLHFVELCSHHGDNTLQVHWAVGLISMFPTARNSLRRYNDNGSSKIPIPIAATLHNLMTETPSGEKKWFRPEHDTGLLPQVRLDILVEDGEIVYSKESTKSVHPSWEHLEERIDLSGEWWLNESCYKSMKFRFTLLEADTSDIDSNNSIFLEVPIYPSSLQRLDCTPDALPPNACIVYFSDGSTRVPQNIFQVLLDGKLTEHPPIEDFSRFEDDAFRVLDQTTPSRRERTASSLLDPEEVPQSNESTPTKPPEDSREVVAPAMISFDDSEQDIGILDSKREQEFLKALIAQEEEALAREELSFNQVSRLCTNFAVSACSI